jgi:hypothetical protein
MRSSGGYGAAMRLAGVGLGALALVGWGWTWGGAGNGPLPCSRGEAGFVPLTDLGSREYRGFTGGLYAGGSNSPPASYLALGRAAATKVVPRGPDGRASANGLVVLLSVGMSNAAAEFGAFVSLVPADGRTSRNVRLVDGAVPGFDARQIVSPRNPYWALVVRRLAISGASAAQVQAVWLKEAIERPSGRFPADARVLRDDLRTIVRILAQRFRNLQLVYLSSRTYGGYARTPLNPEPYAYGSGFAVKWTITERMRNRAGRPWVGWGPYLWTDGTKGRADGLVWTCDDVAPDGTHPSGSGMTKVAQLLLGFFTTDPTARSWFTAK